MTPLTERQAVVDDLCAARMNAAADLVERSVQEALPYYAFPDIHWQKQCGRAWRWLKLSTRLSYMLIFSRLRASITGYHGLGDRAMRWSKLVLEFAMNQGLAQVVGMVSGLIYVRLMPVDEYALYAIGLSTLTILTAGSDLGLTGSLSYFWRQGAKGDAQIEARIAAVRKLRSLFLVFASFVCGALLWQTAVKQNLPIVTLFVCFVLIIATGWLQTRTSIDVHLMRLRGMQRESYYCEAAGSVARFLVAISMFATGISMAFYGLAGSLLGSACILGALFWTGNTTTGNLHLADAKSMRDVLLFIAPTLPTTVTYMVQDPLVLWLALTFGGQTPVSETFAVGRIAAMFALLGTFIVTVVVPRLACIVDDKHFARMAATFFLLMLAFCAAATTTAYLAPWTLLFLIGQKYSHLHEEVALSFVASSLGILIAFLAISNRLRGWVRLEPAVALCHGAMIVFLASRWSFQDSASVWKLMIALAGVNFLCFLLVSIVGMLMPSIVKIRL